MREGHWKYLRLAGREHLFNLALDARECAERKHAEPARFAGLKAAWEEWNATMLPYPMASFSEDVFRLAPE